MINLHLGHPHMIKAEWETIPQCIKNYEDLLQGKQAATCRKRIRGHQSPTVTKPSCTGEPLAYRTIMLSHMDTKQHQKNLIAEPFTKN